jgi:hypothetical protein
MEKKSRMFITLFPCTYKKKQYVNICNLSIVAKKENICIGLCKTQVKCIVRRETLQLRRAVAAAAPLEFRLIWHFD